MAVDGEGEAAAPAPTDAANGGAAGARIEGMAVDKPSKQKIGFKLNMKRGQKTRTQQLRKNTKLEGALARSDKVTSRLSLEKNSKVRKLTLKHMY
ncbi:hypothetical protein FOA52_010844 [Chlamydomonas sp. UWO 241]|nr:hypothetical protein FOA52_010844 [Chlamydomonas sp. UWO 241]